MVIPEEQGKTETKVSMKYIDGDVLTTDEKAIVDANKGVSRDRYLPCTILKLVTRRVSILSYSTI